MEHGFSTASCTACVRGAARTPPWKTLHRSSTLKESTFSVQTGGATSIDEQYADTKNRANNVQNAHEQVR